MFVQHSLMFLCRSSSDSFAIVVIVVVLHFLIVFLSEKTLNDFASLQPTRRLLLAVAVVHVVLLMTNHFAHTRSSQKGRQRPPTFPRHLTLLLLWMLLLLLLLLLLLFGFSSG